MRMLLLAAAFAFQASSSKAADFAKWWPQFQAAVAARDSAAVAQGAVFPLDWENGPIRKIESAAGLKARFDAFFTAEIGKAIATKKPERLPTGLYIITWRARGNEYSIMFRPKGETFALDSLSEGPP